MINYSRKWTYWVPGSEECDVEIQYVYTERAILREYWQQWVQQMCKANKQHLISEEHCIEDWIVLNWAQRYYENECN